MTTDIKDLLPELPDDNSGKSNRYQPSIEAVDRIADGLVTEYRNPQFRRWYCGVVYQFGPQKVLEWQGRARDGSSPAKLFSKYVKDAQSFRSLRGK